MKKSRDKPHTVSTVPVIIADEPSTSIKTSGGEGKSERSRVGGDGRSQQGRARGSSERGGRGLASRGSTEALRKDRGPGGRYGGTATHGRGSGGRGPMSQYTSEKGSALSDKNAYVNAGQQQQQYAMASQQYGYYPAGAYPGYGMYATQPNYSEMLIQQVEYYFGIQNMVKDLYLRKKMDAEGWIPVSVIVAFNRVKTILSFVMASDPLCAQLGEAATLLQVVQGSSIVEVSTGMQMLRCSEGWEKWVLAANEREPVVPEASVPIAQIGRAHV